MEFNRIALVWGKGGAEILMYLIEQYPGCEVLIYHSTGYFADGFTVPRACEVVRCDVAYDIPDFRHCAVVAHCRAAGDVLDRLAVDVNVARGLLRAMETLEGVIWRGGVLGVFLHEKYKIPML